MKGESQPEEGFVSMAMRGAPPLPLSILNDLAGFGGSLRLEFLAQFAQMVGNGAFRNERLRSGGGLGFRLRLGAKGGDAGVKPKRDIQGAAQIVVELAKEAVGRFFCLTGQIKSD